MTTRGLDTVSLNRGLKRLAGHVNLVVKYTPPQYVGKPEGFNAFFPEAQEGNVFLTTDNRLNWLMRYAADVTLANPFGGGFYTNLLLGRRMILIHTSRCWAEKLGRPANFPYLLRDTGQLWVKAAYNLCPIHIEATDMIVERLHDEAYWERYDRDVPRLAQGVMGRSWIGEEAAERAAMFITRVLDRGTFKPTPEEIAGCRVVQGPVSYEFPTDIYL